MLGFVVLAASAAAMLWDSDPESAPGGSIAKSWPNLSAPRRFCCV
jgi:hypothetical protein